jgi:DNA invertase Pin-like site-specific DNA recombinase
MIYPLDEPSKISDNKEGVIFPTNNEKYHPSKIAQNGDNKMKAYLYIRVSTGKQQRSGLGKEAQLKSCFDFAKTNNIEVLGTYEESQSGKDADRPVLQEALAQAKQEDAMILVAKLDRLSRSVADIAVWMREKVKFCVVDMGLNTDNFMLHIYASFAELERVMIGKRTKDALAQAKQRGVKLGSNNPSIQEAALSGKRKQGEETLARILPYIEEAKKEGITSYKGIAKYLNENGIKSPRGGLWYTASVSKMMKRI